MPNLKLTLSYDGTDFVGWQRQAKGRSVQGELEDALSRMDKRAVAAVGAGRTDSGVHALAQVASAQIVNHIPPASVRQGLNAILPEDVRVVAVEEAPASFNARHDARSKTYRYRIFNGDTLSPFVRRYAWHVPHQLDLTAMRAAARCFVGRHDCAALQAAGSDVVDTVRTIGQSDWLEIPRVDYGRVLVYQIAGSGFLRHMVRTMVGTLVEVGAGRREPGSMDALLASKRRGLAGPTAPPQGLYLARVDYDPATGALDADRVGVQDGRDILQ
jgi:tRNA pseudouridine38-40 synthase